MTNSPLVSFGMPVYNGNATIRQALDSLVAQDYPNIEIFIADDNSSDETAEICQEYAVRHPFIRLERNAQTLGPYGNFDKTLGASRGKYFVWASQDDYWHKEFASRLVRILEDRPEMILAMGGTQTLWDDNDEPISIISRGGADLPQGQSYYQNSASLMCKRRREKGEAGTIKNNLYIHGVIRRDLLLRAVGAFPGLYPTERQLLTQLALAGRMYFINELLFWKRVHRVGHADVNPDHPNAIRMKRRFPRLKVWWELGRSIAASPIIPVQRKFYFPVLAVDYFVNVHLRHAVKSGLVRLIDSLPGRLGMRLRRLARRP